MLHRDTQSNRVDPNCFWRALKHFKTKIYIAVIWKEKPMF